MGLGWTPVELSPSLFCWDAGINRCQQDTHTSATTFFFFFFFNLILPSLRHTEGDYWTEVWCRSHFEIVESESVRLASEDGESDSSQDAHEKQEDQDRRQGPTGVSLVLGGMEGDLETTV